MRITSSLDGRLMRLLQIEGFMRKGNVFLRIHGEGVLQCVFSAKESMWKLPQKRPICVSMHSIYEPNVFGDIKLYRGALTEPYALDIFNADNCNYPSHYELFAAECLPKLNQMSTQHALCDAITNLDLVHYGEVRWYMDMLTIPALMYTGDYSLAHQKCQKVLSWNNRLSSVLQMQSLLENGNICDISNYLDDQKKKNMEIYSTLNFR